MDGLSPIYMPLLQHETAQHYPAEAEKKTVTTHATKILDSQGSNDLATAEAQIKRLEQTSCRRGWTIGLTSCCLSPMTAVFQKMLCPIACSVGALPLMYYRPDSTCIEDCDTFGKLPPKNKKGLILAPFNTDNCCACFCNNVEHYLETTERTAYKEACSLKSKLSPT